MKKISILLLVLLVVGLIVFIPGKKIARKHVNYMTAVEDHPLNCINCHLYMTSDSPLRKLLDKDYLSPLRIAVSHDGKTLYVTANDAGSVIVVDAESKTVRSKINVGAKPYSIIIDKEGKKGYVSNQWSDNVMVIDLASNSVIDTLNTGNGPAGLSFNSTQDYIYAVNAYSSDLSVINLQSGTEVNRIETGNNPTNLKLSPDGKSLIVSARRSEIVPYGEPLVTDLTAIDDETRRIKEFVPVESAYLMENVAFAPSGDLTLFTLIRPKNLIPSLQVESGWMMTNGFGVIENKESGRVLQFLVDEPNSYYSDPFDIVITPDGKRAFISNSGVNSVSVVNLDSLRSLIGSSTPEMLELWPDYLGISSKYVEKHISTGANPKGLALSPDGKILYVADHLDDRITVINTGTLETEGFIELGGPKKVTVSRQGRRLLNNSGHTFQNQYSCYTCHPDEHEDGLMYNMASKDMGRNITNTQSLREIGKTAPYKWNGKNQTVFKQDGMRFSTVLTRTEAFSYPDLDAIATYIMTGNPNPPNLRYNPSGVLNEAQERGKAIFERTKTKTGKEIPENNRCITCHPAPYYTIKKSFDVSTLAASDDSILFDTPHLNNIWSSPPYLHDGRAKTLEEIWTLFGKDDKHGITSDMNKNDLNDMIEYLKSLSSPDYGAAGKNKSHAATIILK